MKIGHVALLLCTLAAMAFNPTASVAQEAQRVFHFNQAGTCTFLLDLQPQRAEVEGLSGDARLLSLAKYLLKEFGKSGNTNCSGAANVRAVAVFIPGVDNYGRPAFGSRINLLTLRASVQKFTEAHRANNLSPEFIRQNFEIDTH